MSHENTVISRHCDLLLGVLGGMGPRATADFLAKLVEVTAAATEQDHLRVLVDSNPKVPDRNSAIAGQGESPASLLESMAAGRLDKAGADMLVMACNTAHAFESAIRRAITIPFISIVEEACDACMRETPTARRVGLLAAPGSVQSGLYQLALQARGRQPVLLESREQVAFNGLLYQIKWGAPVATIRPDMKRLGELLVSDGADVLIAACTEVPLVLSQADLMRPLIDATHKCPWATHSQFESSKREGLTMHLAKFPRTRLGQMMTPLEFMPRLTALLDGPNLYVKRDDCTGLATGGNKTRKLEFLMADAIARGADTVITQGATQSNHARQTVAAAARLGLACEILLEDRTGYRDHVYVNSGNVFLDRLLGAPTRTYVGGTDMNTAMQQVADEVRARGGRPYVIPGGGSNSIGALGYVNCALEILMQANDQRLQVDRVVHATGSAGTQAGLVTGFEAMNSGIEVFGIGVRAAREAQENSVYKLACQTADLLGISFSIRRERVVANCDYAGEGYGLPTPGMVEAVSLVARHEGILLDPVYSGKGMAGLIDLIRKGKFSKGENIVFVHTGGSAALFGYTETFADVLAPSRDLVKMAS